jgi:hypothetical protein
VYRPEVKNLRKRSGRNRELGFLYEVAFKKIIFFSLAAPALISCPVKHP